MNNPFSRRAARLRPSTPPAAPVASPYSSLMSAPPQPPPPRTAPFALVRFSVKEQTLFAKRLAFLVTAGVPILECLHLIRAQTKSRAKMRVYDAIIHDVANGQFLAASLGKFNRLFGDFAVNLIRVGEESGILSQNLTYLADELQKKHALQRKVMGALVYPIFITIATLGLTAMLTAYIFPKLMPIFTSLNVDLPITTRALIATSDYLRAWGLLTVIVLIALGAAFLFARSRMEGLRYWSDRLILRLPLTGSIARAYNLTNFCRTLGLLLRSGVTLTGAIAITAETTKNRAYRLACRDLAERALTGEALSASLARRKDLFPDLLAHMVAVGERTGNLSNTLMYLAELYEGDVEDLTKNVSSSIEPALMIVMGVLVGLIAVSVITPIYEITQHLNPHQ